MQGAEQRKVSADAGAGAAAGPSAPAAGAAGREKRKGVVWAHRRKAASNRSKMHERNR
jgi:hypothetical protein|eukprot:COSAG06_NODE_3358_length_5458_cov_7.822542_6_plen_58_part_00